MECENDWEVCVLNENYEINVNYPHVIRRISDKREVIERLGNDYVRVTLGNLFTGKHRVIATQWVPNPDELPEVDHVNHDRSDNHINNLKWCSRVNNLVDRLPFKCQPIKYVIKMPTDVVKIDSYNGIKFNKYVYSYEHHRVISVKGKRFVALTVNNDGVENISLYDVNRKSHFFSWTKLQKHFESLKNAEALAEHRKQSMAKWKEVYSQWHKTE